jgi:hypothetical protein
MDALEEVLKTHTDNGGDLRSVPIKLLNDAICSDQRFTTRELGVMYMLVRQRKDYDKTSERVTTLEQWITTFEGMPTSSRSDDSGSEASIQAEIQAEIRELERNVWRQIAGRPRAKKRSKEERERWRRIDEPSPSPEVDVRKRKR